MTTTAGTKSNWWIVVLAAASIAAIAMGLRQVMGLYLKPISMDLGLGRQAFSLAIAVANIVWGFAAPFVGAISDRYGTGRVAVMGGVTTAIGLYATYAAQIGDGSARRRSVPRARRCRRRRQRHGRGCRARGAAGAENAGHRHARHGQRPRHSDRAALYARAHRVPGLESKPVGPARDVAADLAPCLCDIRARRARTVRDCILRA